MEKKFFTIDEVNQLLPQIEHHFRKMLECKKSMNLASRRLKKMGAAPQLLETAPADPRPEIQELQDQMRLHYESFKNHTLAIENLGGRIKDFELGRVEFLSREGDGTVSLVWQLGVTDRVHPEEI